MLLNGLLGTATFSIDRLLINKKLGAEAVGLYQAHFFATYGVISTLMTVVLTYAYPFFCKNSEMNTSLSRVNKIQYPFTIAISVGIGGGIMWMYSYPVSIALLSILSVFTAINFHVQLKSMYFISCGPRLSKKVFWSQVVYFFVNIITLLISIEYIGIIAGGVSLLVGASLSLICLVKSDIIPCNERIV